MASIVVNGDTSGAVTLSAPAVAGTVTVTLPSANGTMLTTASSTGISGSAISSGTVPEAYGGTGTSTGYYGFKNRIINGAMVIDQRNAGASVTVTTDGQYTLDRWSASSSAASKFSVQQNAGSVTPPIGFKNYLGATSLSAYSVGSSDYFGIRQKVEGFNVADLGWGTANAKAITISFQVYSSLTGTFGASLANSAQDRSYPFTYSIPVANTWTTISATIAGDTSGTWLSTNGIGVGIQFGLGVGATFSGTAGAWAAANYISATGATSVVGTSGATFNVTGVQLEKGSTATSFDYRPYGTELALCQRYYYRIQAGVAGQIFGSGYIATTSSALITTQLPVQMRTSPSALDQTGAAADYRVNSLNIATVCSSVPTFNNSSTNFAFTTFTTAATLVAGQGCAGAAPATAGYLGWSAEL